MNNLGSESTFEVLCTVIRNEVGTNVKVILNGPGLTGFTTSKVVLFKKKT